MKIKSKIRQRFPRIHTTLPTVEAGEIEFVEGAARRLSLVCIPSPCAALRHDNLRHDNLRHDNLTEPGRSSNSTAPQIQFHKREDSTKMESNIPCLRQGFYTEGSPARAMATSSSLYSWSTIFPSK